MCRPTQKSRQKCGSRKIRFVRTLNVVDHCINWKECIVLRYVNSYRRRLIAESWFINAHPNVINRSDGETFPSVYRSLAKRTQ